MVDRKITFHINDDIPSDLHKEIKARIFGLNKRADIYVNAEVDGQGYLIVRLAINVSDM